MPIETIRARRALFRSLAGGIGTLFVALGYAFYGVVETQLVLSWVGLGLVFLIVALTGIGLKPRDSGDQYRAVSSAEHTLMQYPCGVGAGDLLRIKQDLDLLDHDGRPTRGSIPAGSIWTVLPGLQAEPDVVWLREPGGQSHTWDASILDHFEKISAHAAQQGVEPDVE